MSITKYADSTGLTEFWGKVKSHVTTAISGKQDTLVSGTNIKTVNNNSLLGSGNITIEGGDDHEELTQAQYDQLTPTEQMNGTVYFITDGVPGSQLPILNFLYPVGTCYETTDVNFNPNTALGGTWVLEDEHIIKKEKLLWTNNNPQSIGSFTVSLDLSGYNQVEIVSLVNINSSADPNYIVTKVIEVEGQDRSLTKNDNLSNFNTRRAVVTTTGVDFEQGYYADAEDPNRMIPLTIKGIKEYTHYCWHRTA